MIASGWVKRCALVGAMASISLASSGAPMKYDSNEPGGTDHPIISRYAGSILVQYGSDNYGTAKLAVMEKGALILTTVEGRISNKTYLAPMGRSPLEVFRNYQRALTAGGFETLLSCETSQCEKLGVQPLISNIPREAKWTKGDNWTGIFNSGNSPLFHYISARKTGPNGVVHAQIGLVGTRDDNIETLGRTQQFVQVIESAQVEQGKVTVMDASAITHSLKQDGKIVLHGLLFDTGKAVIKTESGPLLEEMGKVLKVDPDLKVFIVGHTDNQGTVETNVALSQKRAEAVVEALNKRYGIAADRLQARGLANFSPVGNNLSEDGRSKNRRVEMVSR
jgi:OmpA-OmpF porin, OOP family